MASGWKAESLEAWNLHFLSINFNCLKKFKRHNISSPNKSPSESPSDLDDVLLVFIVALQVLWNSRWSALQASPAKKIDSSKVGPLFDLWTLIKQSIDECTEISRRKLTFCVHSINCNRLSFNSHLLMRLATHGMRLMPFCPNRARFKALDKVPRHFSFNLDLMIDSSWQIASQSIAENR